MENDNNHLELTKSTNKKVNDFDRSGLELTISNNYMEACFSNFFEDVRHESSLILSLSPVEPDILEQSKFTDNEVNIMKDNALEKNFVSGILKSMLLWIC